MQAEARASCLSPWVAYAFTPTRVCACTRHSFSCLSGNLRFNPAELIIATVTAGRTPRARTSTQPLVKCIFGTGTRARRRRVYSAATPPWNPEAGVCLILAFRRALLSLTAFLVPKICVLRPRVWVEFTRCVLNVQKRHAEFINGAQMAQFYNIALQVCFSSP